MLAVISMAATPAPAADEKPAEYAVKAAFLYSFARFTDWPAAQPDTLHICILGEDPFGDAFDRVRKAAAPQPVRIVHTTTLSPAPSCHILYISRSESARLGHILALVGTRPVLTVSDVGGFAERGGMVCFVMRDKRVRFQINTAAAERAGIGLSAKLLRLAELVEESDGSNKRPGR